jgi:hypothetical protein
MKHRILTTTALGLALFGALLVPYVRADEVDKMTTIKFSAPVEIPGKVLLPGTYVFKLLNGDNNTDIVQIFNADDTRLITAVKAIPDYRATPSDHTILSLEERHPGQPEAVMTWFYPGDNFGEQFVYPK